VIAGRGLERRHDLHAADTALALEPLERFGAIGDLLRRFRTRHDDARKPGPYGCAEIGRERCRIDLSEHFGAAAARALYGGPQRCARGVAIGDELEEIEHDDVGARSRSFVDVMRFRRRHDEPRAPRSVLR
jgi:hypothetical protein